MSENNETIAAGNENSQLQKTAAQQAGTPVTPDPLNPQQATSGQGGQASSTNYQTNQQRPQFQSTQQGQQMPADMNAVRRFTLNEMLDVPITLVFEVGRTQFSIKELLDLTAGSFINFRNVDVDTIDIRINDELVANGETIALQQRYGVRFGEVVKIKNINDIGVKR